MRNEFKIRRNPGFWQRWEDRPVVLTFLVDEMVTANSVASNLFKHNEDAVEIRWNRVGSSQGHYVSANPNIERMKKVEKLKIKVSVKNK